MSEDLQNNGGLPVPGWEAPPRPARQTFDGRFARLDPMVADHAEALFHVFEDVPQNWRYMPVGPFRDVAACAAWTADAAASDDPLFFVVRSGPDNAITGFLSLLRISPAAGSIEVGFINFGPALQRTPAATEAVWLLMDWAFAAGYRRFEWKCDSLNRASRRSAQRFGLSYEGIFRQALVVKGRNRDTAWFAAIDREYPALKTAFESWLSPANFDAAGQQRARLGDLTATVLVQRDPG